MDTTAPRGSNNASGEVSDQRSPDRLRTRCGITGETTETKLAADSYGSVEPTPAFAPATGMTPDDDVGEPSRLITVGEKSHNGSRSHVAPAADDATPHLDTAAFLRRLNESLERQASEIAQRLHDEAGQLLTSAYIAVARAKREVPPSAHEHLDAVKCQLDGIEEQLRRLAHEVRPRILDDLGLVPAIRFLADGIAERSGIAVHVASNLTTRPPALLETTIYRFVQEALSNARRHASPSRVTILLEQLHRRLRCTVRDDGVGFDAATLTGGAEEGMGLHNLRDRIEALDGTVHVESAPGEGTQVSVTIPMET
jgi:signal transduction histidine kinase